MVTAVVNAISPPRTVPYLSNDMFRQHRSGVAITNLVAGAAPQDQDAALAGYIFRATSMIDSWLSTSLAASVDTDEGPLNYHQGYWSFQPRFRPVVALLGFSVGVPGQLTAYTSLDGASVTDNMIRVPAGPAGNWMSSQGPIQLGPPYAWPDRGYGRWTYCNGYPVTWLTQPEAQGATARHVADTTGILAGVTQLTVWSGRTQTRFTAGTVSTADESGFGTGPGTVVCPALPLAITNDPTYPTYVTGLSGDVIEAAVLGTRALIKKSASGNLTVQTTTGGNRNRNGDPLGAGDDLAEMYRLLTSYQVLST